MTADTIRAALDAATRTGCNCDCATVQPGCRKQMAEEIAAFLRAVPVITDLPPGPDRMGFWDGPARERWAAAVEEAARDG